MTIPWTSLMIPHDSAACVSATAAALATPAEAEAPPEESSSVVVVARKSASDDATTLSDLACAGLKYNSDRESLGQISAAWLSLLPGQDVGRLRGAPAEEAPIGIPTAPPPSPLDTRMQACVPRLSELVGCPSPARLPRPLALMMLMLTLMFTTMMMAAATS